MHSIHKYDSFPEVITLKNKSFQIYLNPQEIDYAITNIAKRISKDYTDKTPLFVVILNGAVMFAADLMRKVVLDTEVEFVSAKSYGSAMESSGKVLLKDFGLNVKGRDIIIVEDIVDTGHTLTKLYETLNKFEPNSIKTACLLSKTAMRKVDVDVHYIGFEIEPVFVVGYGLDYDEKGRQLPAIYKLV